MSLGITSKRIEKIEDSRGCLDILSFSELTFSPKRMYWISGAKYETFRGQHAHKLLLQAFFVITGRLEIIFKDHERTEKITLTPGKIFEIPSGLWRDIQNFKEGTILAVLCSEDYDESDYIRNWEEFMVYSRERND